jgi:hypothetical protein
MATRREILQTIIATNDIQEVEDNFYSNKIVNIFYDRKSGADFFFINNMTNGNSLTMKNLDNEITTEESEQLFDLIK